MTSAVLRHDVDFDDPLVQLLAHVVAAHGRADDSRRRDYRDRHDPRPFGDIGVGGRHEPGYGADGTGSDEQAFPACRTPSPARNRGEIEAQMRYRFPIVLVAAIPAMER